MTIFKNNNFMTISAKTYNNDTIPMFFEHGSKRFEDLDVVRRIWLTFFGCKTKIDKTYNLKSLVEQLINSNIDFYVENIEFFMNGKPFMCQDLIFYTYTKKDMMALKLMM